MDIYDSNYQLTTEQIAFIQDINNFCQNIFGFSINEYLAYSESWFYKRMLYLVVVCPKYQLWPNNTPMNKFYVYFGNSESVANEMAERYRKQEYDVYVADHPSSYTSAPEKPIVIIPSFFEGIDLSEKIDAFKLDKIRILLHEAFHAHVHRNDIGLENYSHYLTIQEMSKEETTAVFVGRLAQIEYLLYKKQDNKPLMTEMSDSFRQLADYYYLDDDYHKLNRIYNNIKLSKEEKEKRKQAILMCGQSNNASLLLHHLYYGNQFTRKYFGMFNKRNHRKVIRKIIRKFVKSYWKKHHQ